MGLGHRAESGGSQDLNPGLPDFKVYAAHSCPAPQTRGPSAGTAWHVRTREHQAAPGMHKPLHTTWPNPTHTRCTRAHTGGSIDTPPRGPKGGSAGRSQDGGAAGGSARDLHGAPGDNSPGWRPESRTSVCRTAAESIPEKTRGALAGQRVT